MVSKKQQMRRIYKEDSPLHTIRRIKEIINNIGAVTYESYYGHPHTNVYSCRTELVPTFGTFGQNGKGTTLEYALASSHAEFIERLQNGLLFGIKSLSLTFLEKLRKEMKFVFFPDEKNMGLEEFMNLPIEYLQDICGNESIEQIRKEAILYFNEAKKNGFDGIISVPFFDFKSQDIIYLPYNISLMITGSNGMSAGNSTNEGVFQALCEIIERAAAATVYHENLTPPTVPMDYIKQYPIQYNIIREIKAEGYDIYVKDFSVNCKLPVVGTIIINRKTNKYRLNIGADTCFDIALSRTLTEIYQGISNKKEMESFMLDIPDINKFKKKYIGNQFKIDENLERFFRDGTGLFPPSLFGRESSYSFDSSAFCETQDYLDGCKYLLKLIDSLGSRVFLRDTSFLGFPSFYIYATKISSFRNKGIQKSVVKTLDLKSNIDYEQIWKYLKDLENIYMNKEAMTFMVHTFPPKFVKDCDQLMADFLKLEFVSDFYWSKIPVSYFLVIFAYLLEDFSNAAEYLRIYIKTMNIEKSIYYEEVLKYFKMLEENTTKENIDSTISAQVINNFEKDNIIHSIEYPQCPNCTDCALKNSCCTHEKLKLYNVIQLESKNHIVNQEKFIKFCN